MTDERHVDPAGDPSAAANTVAVIGLILTAVAAVLCLLLFVATRRVTANATSSSVPPASSSGEWVVDGADVMGAVEAGEEDTSQAVDAAASDETAVPDTTIDTPAQAGSDEAITAQQSPPAPSEQPQYLQLLLLAIAAAVLNLVGMVLSISGLLMPDRPRGLALLGTVFSLLLFAGVFGVVIIGTLLNPAGNTEATAPPSTAAVTP